MKGTYMEWVVLHKFVVLLSLILICSLVTPHSVFASTAFAPGDHFEYHEVETVSNGTGSYSGYADQTTVNGGETMSAVSGSTVSANYSYSYSFSDNQGSSTATSQGGSYTWSDSSFLYVSGTDDETGYVNPTVWFAMNATLPVGAKFALLNTNMTIISRNETFYLPAKNVYVTTIYAQGSGSYVGSPQNNAYGNFSAKYTWNGYFDPTTGYILGYHYVEQDTSTNGNGTGFGYVDDLSVTSTTYPLTVVSSTQPTSSQSSIISSTASSTSSTFSTSSFTSSITSSATSSQATPSSFSVEDVGIIAVVVIIIVAVLVLTRRRKPNETVNPGIQT
jgi:hypothetical protein